MKFMTALIFWTFSHILSSKFSRPYRMAFCSLFIWWFHYFALSLLPGECMVCIYNRSSVRLVPFSFFENCQQHSCNWYISNLSRYDLHIIVVARVSLPERYHFGFLPLLGFVLMTVSFTLQVFIALMIKLGSSTSLSWQEQVFLEDTTLDFYLCLGLFLCC